jgi:hypothetical protein
MSFPSQAGTPSYSGTFIPEIWSSKLQVKFYDNTVLGAIANHNWEGEIKNQGDKVKIRTIPTLTINDYSSGQNLVNQRPESPNIELLIDKGKYWSAIVDDVMEVQADVQLMNTWSNDAAQQMKIAVDTDVLSALAPDIAALNKGASAGRVSGNINLGAAGAPIGLTKVNILDYLVDLGQVMDEQNIPEDGRGVVIPAWAASLLKKSDLKDASLTGDGASVMRNGRLGMIDRFTLYVSNLLPRVTDGTVQAYNIYAMHKECLSFASQITKTETLRAESTFGNIMRGLNVYGYKVTKPEAGAVLYAYKA